MYTPRLSLALTATLACAGIGIAQVHQIRIKPTTLTLPVGGSKQIEAEALDAGGRPAKANLFWFSRDITTVKVSSTGEVTGLKPGLVEVVVRAAGTDGISAILPVRVASPELARVVFSDSPAKVFTKTTITLEAAVLDAKGTVRKDLRLSFESTAPEVARVDDFGQVTGLRPGPCTVIARAQGVEARHEFAVVANPVRALELSSDAVKARTGDVLHFQVKTTLDPGVEQVPVPIEFSLAAFPKDDLGPGASGQIQPDGRFVAETPGRYTVVATCGDVTARRTVEIVARNIRRRIEFVGHGPVRDVHSSDLWVWEGIDGRDYAVTGTWGGDGEAIFWDVTDPTKLERIATVKVDARTVNDVKVSADGRTCVISREGASNRKNGVIVLDVSDPHNPKMLSTFTDKLTGGVHNLFVDKNHVYALSAGRRYDVLDISDRAAPVRVASYELKGPRHAIHDVWVQGGIAYSSNWRDGVHLVDVGNGIKGGSPSNPVPIASYAYPSGWNHAAFPYRSTKTGKFYVVAGDEAFPYGLSLQHKPTYPRGWFHFIDFSDLDEPREVARYQVPEAGTHNLWIEGDLLYAAYYNAGLRVVDISGELMGDLYKQGREIGSFLPADHEGVVPNAPMTWGPQPHRGHIFFTDWNSGLWAVKLGKPDRRPR